MRRNPHLTAIAALALGALTLIATAFALTLACHPEITPRSPPRHRPGPRQDRITPEAPPAGARYRAPAEHKTPE
jgi:hypothetical protein